jgi:hypothetical protein
MLLGSLLVANVLRLLSMAVSESCENRSSIESPMQRMVGILTTQRRTTRPDPEWEADADRHLTPEGIAQASASNSFAV